MGGTHLTLSAQGNGLIDEALSPSIIRESTLNLLVLPGVSLVIINVDSDRPGWRDSVRPAGISASCIRPEMAGQGSFTLFAILFMFIGVQLNVISISAYSRAGFTVMSGPARASYSICYLSGKFCPKEGNLFMKVVIFACHDMGYTGLRVLLDAGCEIAALFTLQDTPGENLFFNTAVSIATKHGVPVYAPEEVNDPKWVDHIRNLSPDVIFSFCYRKLLCDSILQIPTVGAFNLHASLLPAYRGECPLHWVLENGEKETGVTLHRMEGHPYAGNIIIQHPVNINEDDNALKLHLKLSHAAETLLRDILPALCKGTFSETVQDESQASYFGRRTPENGRLIWERPARQLHNLIRAVSAPWPGAFAFAGTQKFIIWKSRVRDDLPYAKAGTVLSVAPLIVACGKQALEIKTGETENGDYVQGRQLAQSLGLVTGSRLQNQSVAMPPPAYPYSSPRCERLYG